MFRPAPRFFQFAGLAIDLEETLGVKVDLCTEVQLHPKLKDRILAEFSACDLGMAIYVDPDDQPSAIRPEPSSIPQRLAARREIKITLTRDIAGERRPALLFERRRIEKPFRRGTVPRPQRGHVSWECARLEIGA